MPTAGVNRWIRLDKLDPLLHKRLCSYRQRESLFTSTGGVLDFAEPSKQRALHETVGSVVSSFARAHYAESAWQSPLQEELWRDFGKAGFIGINVPREYGGSGDEFVEVGAVTKETAAAAPRCSSWSCQSPKRSRWRYQAGFRQMHGRCLWTHHQRLLNEVCGDRRGVA